MRLGASKDEVIAALPSDPARINARLECQQDESGEKCVLASEAKADGRGGFHPVILGDVSGRAGLHLVPDEDGILRADTIYWSGADLAQVYFVLRPMTEKYGTPISAPITVENGFGEAFDAEEHTWDNGVSTITLQTRCNMVREFCVTYRHGKLVDRTHELQLQAKGDPRSRL